MVHPDVYEKKAIALEKALLSIYYGRYQYNFATVINKSQVTIFLVKRQYKPLYIYITIQSELNEQDQLIKLCNEFIHKMIYIYIHSYIILNLAQALFKQRMFEQVIESWDEVIKKKERQQEYYVEKIKAVNEQNGYPEAIQICNIVINLQLDNEIDIQNWKSIKQSKSNQ
ncbi:unnamed protein product [Paramecium pentaurelia]|uniref:Uncharacterized protein n=1 Tax=Paramecium pentaurelia TaxID=43138 RepID=A0A8S1XMI7_9CILI|nr:unnamed protein product [Paramecium pentaurelia]